MFCFPLSQCIISFLRYYLKHILYYLSYNRKNVFSSCNNIIKIQSNSNTYYQDIYEFQLDFIIMREFFSIGILLQWERFVASAFLYSCGSLSIRRVFSSSHANVLEIFLHLTLLLFIVKCIVCFLVQCQINDMNVLFSEEIIPFWYSLYIKLRS